MTVYEREIGFAAKYGQTQALRRFLYRKARCWAILKKYRGRRRLFFSVPLLSFRKKGSTYVYQGYLGVQTCEVFLCFLAIIFLGSIVLTSQWLLCIHCFKSLLSFTGFYTEDEPSSKHLNQSSAFLKLPSLQVWSQQLSPSFIFTWAPVTNNAFEICTNVIYCCPIKYETLRHPWIFGALR